jgi:hypothetical protein
VALGVACVGGIQQTENHRKDKKTKTKQKQKDKTHPQHLNLALDL